MQQKEIKQVSSLARHESQYKIAMTIKICYLHLTISFNKNCGNPTLNVCNIRERLTKHTFQSINLNLCIPQ